MEYLSYKGLFSKTAAHLYFQVQKVSLTDPDLHAGNLHRNMSEWRKRITLCPHLMLA